MSKKYTGNYLQNSYDPEKRYKIQFQKDKPLSSVELIQIQDFSENFVKQLISTNFPSVSSINNGFKIVQSSSSTNNFTIKGGDGTVNGAGVLFIDGYILFLKGDIEYNNQNNLGSLIDDNYTNTIINSLTTPSSNRIDEVYIDFYFAEVRVPGSYDVEYNDSTLYTPGFTKETSARLRIVQDIKVAEGQTIQNKFSSEDSYENYVNYITYIDINLIKHYIIKIATINRVSGNSSITSSMIIDNRILVNSNYSYMNGTAKSILLESSANIGNDLHRLNEIFLENSINYKNDLIFNNNGEKIRFTSNGNVGIGTSNPLQKLDVRGKILVKNSVAGDNSIIFYDSYGSNIFGSIGFSTNSTGLFKDFSFYSGSTTSQLNLGTHNNSIGFWGGSYGSIQRMIIASDGNVGIGTINPVYKLSVQGDIGFSGTLQQGIVPWTRLSDIPDPTITLSGGVTGIGTMTDLGSVTINTTVANDSHIHDTRYYTETESDNRFVNIDGDSMTGYLNIDGNVGIGTTNSTVKLHVVGDALITNNLTVNGTTTIINTEVTTTDMMQINQDDNQVAFSVNQTGGSGNSATVMEITNTGTGHALTIGNGNVGIGTINPSEKLTVIGKIIATDTIISLYGCGSVNNLDQGSYIGVYKNQGSLPGYPTSYYPVIKTDYNYMYFVANNTYIGHFGNDGNRNSFEIFRNVSIPTATPDRIHLGNSFSDGTTKEKCKLILHNDGTSFYGFGIGSSGDIQYHSDSIHDFYINNVYKVRINSTGVGIGTTNLSYALNVQGDVGFSGTLQQGIVPWARLSDVPSFSISLTGDVSGSGNSGSPITVTVVDNSHEHSRFQSTSNMGTFWLVNNWDGTYWYVTSNNGAPVRVGYANSSDYSNSAGNADTTDGYHLGNRSNWNSLNSIDIVTGQLSWKNFGNNHTIFDASAGTSPDGTAINNINSTVAWSATFPTLMGWNGISTYGIRVDSARVSDNADTLDGKHSSDFISSINGTVGAIPFFISASSIGNSYLYQRSMYHLSFGSNTTIWGGTSSSVFQIGNMFLSNWSNATILTTNAKLNTSGSNWVYVNNGPEGYCSYSQHTNDIANNGGRHTLIVGNKGFRDDLVSNFCELHFDTSSLRLTLSNDSSTYFKVNTSGQIYSDAGTTIISPADLAEWTKVEGNKEIYEVGTIVQQSEEEDLTVEVANSFENVYGIVTDRATFCGGLTESFKDGFIKKDLMELKTEEVENKYNAKRIAMTGHVQCKVVGKIKKGQRITLSYIPGVGKAAVTFEEKTFAFALARENYDSEFVGLIEVRLL